MAPMIESETLNSMTNGMKQAADMIALAIRNKTPILIRHHADCDGYAGAVALERSIIALMDKVHKRESDIHYYYKRLPSKTPFYDLADATKDISGFLTDSARFQRKTPLVIVIDNGSCTEDLVGLKMLKLYRAEIIVIDHHPPNKDNDTYIDSHLNPLRAGGNGGVTAGMVASELAHVLNPKAENLALLAALAGTSDKSREPELSRYLELCKEHCDPAMLQKVAEALDFELTYIGFLESRYLVNDLFFGDMELTRSFSALVEPEIRARKDRQLASIEHYAEVSKAHGKVIARLDLTKAMRMNTYPSAGKTTGMMFEHMSQTHDLPVIAIGYRNDFVTLRISRELPFDVNKIVSHLSEKIPYAQVDGGGHATAGTMRFVPAAQHEILKALEEYFR